MSRFSDCRWVQCAVSSLLKYRLKVHVSLKHSICCYMLISECKYDSYDRLASWTLWKLVALRLFRHGVFESFCSIIYYSMIVCSTWRTVTLVLFTAWADGGGGGCISELMGGGGVLASTQCLGILRCIIVSARSIHPINLILCTHNICTAIWGYAFSAFDVAFFNLSCWWNLYTLQWLAMVIAYIIWKFYKTILRRRSLILIICIIQLSRYDYFCWWMHWHY